MKRTVIGAVWGMVFYLIGSSIVSAIAGSQALDPWRPFIALVAAALAVAGSWKGFLPGTRH
jgi:hypothetical protein